MVIYRQGRGGKVKEGSQISSWDPVVATLPDLSTMQSITYINEVDIRKIKVGQTVQIGLDAFPDKRLTGKVIQVANVGQQRPNSDAKVFEVLVRVNESDVLLRPAMTTSNSILIEEKSDVVYVPLEAINVESDSINYVYLKNGKKQEVKLGLANSNDVIIEMGLEEGQDIFLSTPEWAKDSSISLLAELDGKRNQEEDEVISKADSTMRPGYQIRPVKN
jgi:hypothetical protein